MKGRTFTLRAPFARRMPDPGFAKTLGISRHILFVPANEVPEGLPLDPNPREQNLNKAVYKDLRKSLLEEEGEPGTFHLKHKGITMVAADVSPDGADDQYSVTFDEGQGIVDGGHSYSLIVDARSNGESIPEEQFVKFEVLVNLPMEWIPEIAGGLNTSVQVQPMSLDNLRDRFQFLKAAMEDEPYAGQIAWKENAEGQYDARDIISFLYAFNVFAFPSTEEKHPVEAYSSKAKVLEHFQKNQDQYKRLLPILTDILVLHDKVQKEGRDLYNDSGGRGGKLHFVEQRKRGQFDFPFIDDKGQFRLVDGALYPILASFRWMVDVDADAGEVGWRGGFGAVLDLWNELGAELMRMTSQAGNELGRNPNALGKSRNHWSNLHSKVAMRQMMSQA